MNLSWDPTGDVQAQRAADALAEMVRCRSVTGDEFAIQDLLADMLGEAGLQVERLNLQVDEFENDPEWPGLEVERESLPIVLGRLGTPGRRRVLLVGHVDVVPPGDPTSWTVDPWGADVVDGRLYGRGSCDMKGGCASIVEAARVLSEAGRSERWDGELVVALVPSEEDGGAGAFAAIRSGLSGDKAVIAEPTGLDIVAAHAGSITFRMIVKGKQAHAAMASQGVSALEKLMVLSDALKLDEAARNAAEDHPLMTALGIPYPFILGRVSGGSWASTVMDEVVVEGRYGVRLGQTWRDAETELRECIAVASQRDPWLSDNAPDLEVIGGKFSSASVPEGSDVVAGLSQAAASVVGVAPSVTGFSAGTDMRLFVHEAQIPTVIYGPGSIIQAHTSDEWVPLDEVTTCAQVLAAWADRELGGW